VSHKTAPIEVRERLALSEAAVEGLLSGFRRTRGLRELAYLGTCNRAELLAAADPKPSWQEPLAGLLAQAAQFPGERLAPHLYYLEESDAVRHLFLVASSLDSMVVGETEVLGQLKLAYRTAEQNGSLGPLLHALFQRAFRVAKQLHATCTLGWGRVSVASVAVEFASHIFQDFRGKTALVLGAGEMARLILEHLRGRGLSQVLVLNRSRERADALAAELGAQAHGLEELEEMLPAGDVVLVSTGAPTPVVTVEMAARAVRRRRGRPVFVVDVSVPRNVEEAVGSLAGVYLYDIDDLRAVAEKNQARREAQVVTCLERVEAETERFMNRLRAREVGPLVTALRERAHSQAEEELREMLAHSPLSPQEEERLKELLRRLVNRLLHGPTEAVKLLSTREDGFLYVDALRRLFDLSETED
jgi:glutamyl-tRNA reductase